jgi:hypothetical protein
MRDEAIALLVASSSIVFSMAGVASERSDSHQRFEDRSSESGMPIGALYGPGLRSKYQLRGTMGSPRMITWSVCSAPSNGSALSIYFSHQRASQFGKESAIRDDVLGYQCADEDEEAADENSRVSPWRPVAIRSNGTPAPREPQI